MRDEQTLIDGAKSGSAEAFTELVSGYQNGLLRFLLTRSASFADAEDALQDTLINAYRYIGSYDARWRFSTWLYRIAINNAARNRHPASVDIGELCDEESDPLLQCMADSDRENLWLAARRLLRDDVYVAMWLRYVEDLSIQDISAVLDRSAAWTKVNLMRGRKALDAAFNNDDDDQKSHAYG